MAARSIVILTGAGISQESGLDTFRSEDGLWAKHRIEDVCTPEGFQRDPALVQRFYTGLRQGLADVQPNAAHVALARLEKEWPGEVFLVTQNVDDLHDRAGSRHLLHMHGELMKGTCTACGAVFPWDGEMSMQSVCPSCGVVGRVRPHIVWFGEEPIGMPEIYEALERCDLFISIGTSGNVYPAAGFVRHVRSRRGVRAVEINLEPSLGASLFDDGLYGPATQKVPEYVDRLLTGRDA